MELHSNSADGNKHESAERLLARRIERLEAITNGVGGDSSGPGGKVSLTERVRSLCAALQPMAPLHRTSLPAPAPSHLFLLVTFTGRETDGLSAKELDQVLRQRAPEIQEMGKGMEAVDGLKWVLDSPKIPELPKIVAAEAGSDLAKKVFDCAQGAEQSRADVDKFVAEYNDVASAMSQLFVEWDARLSALERKGEGHTGRGVDDVGSAGAGAGGDGPVQVQE